MMRGANFWLLMLVIAFGCSGCGRQDSVKKGRLTLETVPAAAQVFCGDERLGVTPLDVELPAGEYLLRVEKDKFDPEVVLMTAASGRVSSLKLELTPVSGVVRLRTDPDGAAVIFAGVERGRTPMVIMDMEAGKYRAELRKPGYLPRSVEWEVKSSRPQDYITVLAGNTETLELNSTPAGAEVILDKRRIGMTPFAGTVEVGDHELELKMEGFVSYRGMISVNSGAPGKLDFSLQRLPATIYVVSKPEGAEVYLDGKLCGNTPLEIKNVPSDDSGEHELKVAKTGLGSATRKIKLSSGASPRFDFDLTGNTGDVVFSASPPGVKIFVDDRFIGVVESGASPGSSKPLEIKNLPCGEHTIRLDHRRGRPASREFRFVVERGRTNRLENLTLWVPNAILTMSDGEKLTGNLSRETEEFYYFSQDPGVTVEYEKSSVLSVEKLKMEE